MVEVRGEVYLPLAGFERVNARAGRGRAAHVHEPAQLRGRLAAPAGSGGHRLAGRCRCSPTSSARTTACRWSRTGRRWTGCASRASAPASASSCTTRWRRRWRPAGRGRDGARSIDYDIDGCVVKVSSYAQQRALGVGQPRPALGDRLQVRADHGADRAAADRRERGPHRRAQPVRRAGAGGGRRRHRLAGDAPQRGGHQPQGHPRGRHGDRAAGGRRDPAGGRARTWSRATSASGTGPGRCRSAARPAARRW